MPLPDLRSSWNPCRPRSADRRFVVESVAVALSGRALILFATPDAIAGATETWGFALPLKPFFRMPSCSCRHTRVPAPIPCRNRRRMSMPAVWMSRSSRGMSMPPRRMSRSSHGMSMPPRRMSRSSRGMSTPLCRVSASPSGMSQSMVWPFGRTNLRHHRAEVLANALNVAMQIAGVVFGRSAHSGPRADADDVKHARHAFEKSAGKAMHGRWARIIPKTRGSAHGRFSCSRIHADDQKTAQGRTAVTPQSALP